MSGNRKYDLVALDLDGTTLTSHHSLSERTKAVLHRLNERGVDVVVATGRSTLTIRHVLEAMALPQQHTHIICFNGSSCVKFEGSQPMGTLFSHTLAIPATQRILDFAQKYGYVAQYYHPGTGEIFACPKNEEHIDLMKRYEISVNSKQVVVESYDVAMQCTAPAKILLMTNNAEELVERYEQEFEPGLFHVIVGSPAPFFVEFLPPSVCKGVSLKTFCELKNIDMKRVVAFGDGQNDKELLELAGLGVAMGNAHAMAKEAGDIILQWTNDEDGVARQLESMIEEGLL